MRAQGNLALCMIICIVGHAAALTLTDVRKLSSALKDLCAKELHDNKLKKMFSNSSVMYSPSTVDGDVEVRRLSDMVGGKLKKVADTVVVNKALAESAYYANPPSLPRPPQCCLVPSNGTWKPVNHSSICMSQYSRMSTHRLVPAAALSVFQQNINTHSGITRQYIGDKNGTYYQHPAGGPQACLSNHSSQNDFRYKSWYVNTASQRKKNVAIIIDQSGSMSFPVFNGNTVRTRMDIAMEAAETVVDTFSSRDYAGVVAFSEIAIAPKGCFGKMVGQANDKNKKIFKNFTHSLKPIKGTMYSKGLDLAFKMLSKAKKNNRKQFENSDDYIIFLTDGDPSDKTDKIRQVIVDGNKAMNKSVRVFFYGFGGTVGLQTNMSDLLSFADQNNQVLYHDYTDIRTGQSWNVSSPTWKNYSGVYVGPPGYFTTVAANNADSLRELMGRYYLQYLPPMSNKPRFTLPTVDPQHGLVVTSTVPLRRPVYHDFLGVAATDVTFDSLFNDVSRYKKGTYSYAFLVTREGKVLSHRNYVKPSKVNKDIDFVMLNVAEPHLTSSTIEDITSKAKTGSVRAQVSLAMSRGISQQDGSYKVTLNATYHYRPVKGYDDQYSVVVVMFDEDKLDMRMQKLKNTWASTNTNRSVSYHRLDLKKPGQNQSNVCQTSQQMVQVVNPAISAIKLSSNAFNDPNRYLTKKESIRDVKELEDIIAGIVPNSILQAETFNEILLTDGFEKLSTSVAGTSRYLATRAGVFRISPGVVLGKDYDAMDEPWYEQSALYQDKCVFTRAGYSPTGDRSTVSMSKALHTPQSAMIGAVGVDIPMTFIEAMVPVTITQCGSKIWNCYVVDHSGYIITEPIQSTSINPVSHTHIIKKEPEVINDILRRFTAIKKRQCRQTHGQKSTLWFYDIDPTYPSISNLPSSCTNYTLHPIEKTNLHLLAVSAQPSCNMTSTNISSPCTCTQTCTVCANPNATCQCPCNCASGVNPCTNTYDTKLPPLVCPAPWIPTSPSFTYSTNITLNCPIPCHQRLNSTSCHASGARCRWCKAPNVKGVCLSVCPTPPVYSTTQVTTPKTRVQSCPVFKGNHTVSVAVGTTPSSNCPVTTSQFCRKHCSEQVPCSPEDPEKYTKLAAGLGVPLAALAALSAIGAIVLLKRRPPIPVSDPPKIQPVEPFNPNIFRASMGDGLLPMSGHRGAQIDEWSSNGDGIFGRRVSTASHH